MRAEARLSVLLTASWLDMSCSGVGSLHFSGGSSCSTITTLCRHQTNQCIKSNQFKVKFKHFSNSVRHTLLEDSLFIILVHVNWMSVMNLSIISTFVIFTMKLATFKYFINIMNKLIWVTIEIFHHWICALTG